MAMPQQKPGRSKQDYSTPKDFIAAVKRRLGITAFAHDFAADRRNRKAETFFSRKDSAFDYSPEEWAVAASGRDRSRWGWLNPTFNDITPWANRASLCKDEGGQIAMLVPASVGSNWFRDHVDGQARVLALNGRHAFMPDQPTWLYPKDCMLCLYSPAVKPGFEVWTWKDSL